MSGTRMVYLAYVSLVLYVLFIASSTSLTLQELFPALAQLAAGFAMFALGQRSSPARHVLATQLARSRPASSGLRNFAAGAGVLAAAIVAARYYTGKTPLEVAAYVTSDRSLYLSYQEYNVALSASGGGGINFYFFLLVYIKLILLYSVLAFIPRGGRIRGSEFFLVSCAILAQTYLGLARGTGFELFQIGFVLLFAFALRPRAKVGLMTERIIPILVVIGVAGLYSTFLAARGATASIGASVGDFSVESGALVDLLGASITNFLLLFYDYFGFGFYYVASWWGSYGLTSPTNFTAALIPLGDSGSDTDPTILIRGVIDMGPRWHPDSMLLAGRVGILGLLAVCFLLGRIERVFATRTTVASLIARYYILLQMVSFPLGNFVWIDRAGLIIALGALLIEMLRVTSLVAPTWREFLWGRSGTTAELHASRAHGSYRRNHRPTRGAGSSRSESSAPQDPAVLFHALQRPNRRGQYGRTT